VIPGLTLRAEIVMIGCLVVFALVTAWFVTYQVTQSQHLWCQLLHTLTLPQPKGSPPLTKRGAEVVRDLNNLREGLGCS
jgi:hypothetical protein